jgi:HEAT repeat protein
VNSVIVLLLDATEAQDPWFYGTMAAITCVLLLLNVAVVVAVHGRRIRQWVRAGRQEEFVAEFDGLIADISRGEGHRDPAWLRKEVERFNELERPLAATMLVERLQPMSPAEHEQTLAVLREIGAVSLALRSTQRWMPWRRALAVRTLGWMRAGEAVPTLLDRLHDRSRHVREAAVRALGLIGDGVALPALTELFLSPGSVGAGVVYDALVAFGPDAAQTFAAGLGSADDSVRVSACFGVAAVSAPVAARQQLEPMCDDPSPRVRAAAAGALARVGGPVLPDKLAVASADAEPAVRAAATAALGFFDDTRAVECALTALADPDHETAVRAGESLVRLSRLPTAGPMAVTALQRSGGHWPVERAMTFASVGAI